MKRLRFQNPLVLVLIVLAIAATGAGCGESGESSGSDGSDRGGGSALPTSSLSRAAFDERVEAICARGRREALRYQPAPAGESQRDALTKVIRSTLLPSIAKVIEEIGALGAPQSGKQQVEAMYVAMQKALKRSEALNPPTIEAIEDEFADAGWHARQADLIACIYGDE